MHRMHFPIDALKNWVKARNKRETEAGQSIVIMVLGLIGLLAFAGLVFDGGTAYAQFRRMQNAADAGAMAGANELSKKTPNTLEGITNGQICAAVIRYAHDWNAQPVYGGQTDAKVRVQYILNDPNPANKLKPVPGCHVGAANDPMGHPPDNAQGIRVTVSTTFNTFFLGLLGLGAGTSTAHSSAEYGPASPINVRPLAKRCPSPTEEHPVPCDLRIGERQEIWQSSEPGNLGWLGFNGDVDADNLRDEFDPNLPPVPYIDDMTSVDGVPRTPCKTIGLDCWVQGTPGVSNTLEDHINGLWGGPDDPPMIIVLYDRQVEGGSNTEYHIVGFAAFKLEFVDLSGDDTGYKSVWGTFVRWMDSAAICKDCADTGLYSVHLVPDVVEPPPPPGAKGRICVTVAYDVGVDGHFNAEEDYYLAGATITIKDSSGVTRDSWVTKGISTNCTDAVFDPGTYTVTETNPPGYVTVPLSPDGQGDIQSAVVTAGGTADVLFLDTWPVTDTGNLVVLTLDEGGAVLPSLAAVLKPQSNPTLIVGGPSKSVTGTVYFRNRPPGVYIVSGVPDPGYEMVAANDNVPVTVTVGTTRTVTIKARKYATGKICVRVWDDDNTNGLLDPPPTGTDKSLWGALITLSGTENRTHTMGDGEFNYCFENLRLGPYTVSQSHPPGYSSASLPTPSADSWAGSLTSNGVNIDFRDHVPPRGNLCVEVFDDVTGDGLPTPGEVNIGGANIVIYNAGGAVVTYTTNGTEPKCFSVLVGTYSVVETSNPPGYLLTTPDTVSGVVIVKDTARTVQFGVRASAATRTPTRTRTATPTRTNTPLPNTTPTPTPTRTQTPIPGALCVRVFEDLDRDGIWDAPPPTPGTVPGTVPTPNYTPEPLLAPSNVTVLNANGDTVGTWDGTGIQPCFNNLWPGDYSAIETDPPGYGSTTANNVTVSVTSQNSTMAEYGDKLCFAMPPHMRDPIFQSGNTWLLQWDNLPGTFYRVYASDNSIDPAVPTWRVIKELSGVNYTVERNEGTYFYVTGTDNCGTSGPSNVVSISG